MKSGTEFHIDAATNVLGDDDFRASVVPGISSSYAAWLAIRLAISSRPSIVSSSSA